MATPLPWRSILAVLACSALHAAAEESLVLPSPGAFRESLRREAAAAIDRSAQWLAANQQPAGHWSSPEFPALTALPVWGLILAGRADTPPVRRGIDYILSCVQDDGSIWVEPSAERNGGGLKNYNTAICMVALHLTGDPTYRDLIRRARAFVAAGQHLGDDAYRGGMGYDADIQRAYADLSNSYVAYEAMRLTAELRDLQGGHPEADLDWKAAEAFVSSLQNPDGGIIYKPGYSMAGSVTNETGEVRFRSYGSMTYAGLLSLLYADVSRDDPRIRSAFDWGLRHWSLDENPGMGLEGLYYFYNVLTKALAVYGRDRFQSGGETVHWRSALVRRLLNLQRINPDGAGYWQNDASRWMEADPVLVTSYALIALSIALGETEAVSRRGIRRRDG